MNLDDSKYVLPKGDYSMAFDIVTTESFGGVKTMKGNRKVANNSLPDGVCTVVGAKDDLVRNRVIYFVANANKKHCIFEYNNSTRTIKKIFENLTNSGGVDVLDLNGLILNINIIHKEEIDHILGDYLRANMLTLGLGNVFNVLSELEKTNKDTLYFLDAQGRPTFMNIDRMKWGVYTPVTRDILDVAKDYPAFPIQAEYKNDSTHRVNDMRKMLFKFKYAWVYDDNEVTVWSPVSEMPKPKGSLSEEYQSDPTHNNRIDLVVPTGGKQVKKLKIALSYSIDNGWSDFRLIDTLEKSDYGINDNTTYTYKFYNDIVPTEIDLRDSIQIQDYVPKKAGSQELVNGNTLVYGDITEGFDPTICDVVLSTDYINPGSVGASGTLRSSYQEHISVSDYLYSIIFSGTAVPGVVIKIMLEGNTSGFVFEYFSYTTVVGDTLNSIAANMATAMQSLTGETFAQSATNNVLSFNTSRISTGYHLNEVKIINLPASANEASSAACFLNSTKRKLALVYADEKGRVRSAETNGKMEVTIPAYKESAGIPLLPVINAKINHQPPVWAKSYSWAISKQHSISSTLFWMCVDVKDDNDYLYFDITNLNITKDKNPGWTDVLNYQFAKGDRMRLIRRVNDGFVFDDTCDCEVVGFVVDPKINSVEETGKSFIKIKKENPFAPIDYSSNYFVIQLYSPTQTVATENEVFYEFGKTFKILNPGTSSRAHDGELAAQVAGTSPARFQFSEGDAYMRSRKIYLADTTTNSYYAFDMHFTDSFKSQVSSISGRPFATDDSQEERRYKNMVRFSHAYQPNTNINGVNKFLADNYDEYDVTYGEIKRMKFRDGFMRVYQRLKVGNVPVYAQIIQDLAGNDALSISDKLLNRIKYYEGDFGIGNTPESLASDNFADYFASSDRGTICRVSRDGITPLSITERANAFCVDQLRARGNGSRAYGCFDAETNRYILAMEAAGTKKSQTLLFNERKNGFECFSYLKPEMMVSLGTLLISFKGGHVYTHDNTKYANYFGVQYTPSITIPFNDYPEVKKSFVALSSIGSQLWQCLTIETDNDQLSELNEQDFRHMNGTYHASFLRDKKSPKGLMSGDRLCGHYVFVTLSPLDGSIESELTEVDVSFNPLQLNNR